MGESLQCRGEVVQGTSLVWQTGMDWGILEMKYVRIIMAESIFHLLHVSYKE